MTTSRLTFLVDARDQASRVFGHIGDSAIRLHRDLDDVSGRGSKALDELKKSIISLAPAAIPAAAAMAPIVASTAAAGVAVGVYAAALGPQIAAMAEASEAEKKYNDAVDKSGKGSKEAVQAHEEYRQAMAKLPPATRTAAAALSVLKDQYKSWSDGLAADTMPVVTKGMAAFGSLLPKLTPLVKGTSTELSRMMTILAGGMASPGLDRTIGKFTEFSNKVLRHANDSLVSFVRNLDTGKIGGGLSEFMEYARANGPVLASTLRNIGQAVTNLLIAGSDVGVGMLQVVNVLAKLVAAVPPGAISTLIQLAVAIRLVKLAAAGMAAAQGAVAMFGGQLLAMRTAAGAASGGLTRFTAAFGAMSRGVRVAVAGTGIGLLLIALSELSQMGQRAPADLDRMTTSLGTFAQTGKLTGEASRVLSSNFKEFDEALRGMARPDQLNQIQQSITRFFMSDSTPVKRWKGVLDDVDKSLANMVKSGNAKLAAQAFEQLAARARSQGLTTAELRTQLGDYRAALADVAFEQKLAAQSMGPLGAQALAVQQKLAAQKQTTDGLRQSINALNTAMLEARGGMRGMEAAIDAASKAAKDNGKTLDINTEKGRNNQEALDQLAAATMKAAEAASDNGAKTAVVNAIYERGRTKLMQSARAMGLTESAARKLAGQILQTPDKTARLKGNMADLQAKLAAAKKKLASVPDSRKAAVRANIAQLEAAIARAKRQLAAMDGRTATTRIITYFSSVGQPGSKVPVARRPDLATGGMVGFPGGGPVRGPGTSTSDSILANLSNGEYVIPAKRVAQLGVGFFDSIRDGRVGTAMPALSAMSARAPAMAGPRSTTVIHQYQITVNGALDTDGVARQIDTLLTKRKRNNGGGRLNFEK